jgi:acyl-CoA thioesterase I
MTFVRNLLIIILLSCVNSAIAKQATVLVMGDSLSAGYGIKLEEGWVNLLQQQMSKEIKIVNASVSGETTSGGLTRLPTLLKAHQPAVVILELGGNDGLRGQPLKLMQENLQTMISASQAAGAKVLLIGMQIPTNYGPRYTKQFKEIYPALAEKNNVPLVPFLLEGVATKDELFQSDKIHPIAEAQPILANNVKPFLEKMVKANP